MSKAARRDRLALVTGATRGGPTGITANTVRPGRVETPLQHGVPVDSGRTAR